MASAVIFPDAAPGFNFGPERPAAAQPYPPDIIVRMQSNGAPDSSITKISYHCEGSNSTETGVVSQRIIDFPCSNGECSNSNVEWFYRYNPCYYFHSGFFSYELGKKEMRSKTFTFPQMGRSYYITIDSESGGILLAKKYAADEIVCPSALVFPFIALLALATLRK